MDADYKNATSPNLPKGLFLMGVNYLWTHTRDQYWAGYLNLTYAATPPSLT